MSNRLTKWANDLPNEQLGLIKWATDLPNEQLEHGEPKNIFRSTKIFKYYFFVIFKLCTNQYYLFYYIVIFKHIWIFKTSK